ncbi:MAG: calcium-binding protein [Gomphosphaeria aponina SAG 52.96 = DSM 107014]|uniref:Calcium-binding protein n=1 Tax=Gomphosphaeria aponina SAG 52.96 = DSM 107014 TaxID=1521640 RepID=A0A941GN35_9CHRO|nr:calcium-binding protein [Gomphosphaeria aponina SAG 52.96 = DSM 107014]
MDSISTDSTCLFKFSREKLAHELWVNGITLTLDKYRQDILAAQNAIDGTLENDTLSGNKQPNLINGFEGSDRIVGRGGRDQIFGGSENDILFGGSENDQLNGGLGNDILFGGSENDQLNGGLGGDLLIGGAGADHFILYSPSEKQDIIRDFTTQEDKIIIDAKGFGGGLTPGVLGSESFTLGIAAQDLNDRFIYNNSIGPKGYGKLLYDVDGSGPTQKVRIALFPNAPALTATDFEII